MRYSELVEVYEKLDSTTKRLEKTFFLAEFLMKVPNDELPEVMLLLEGKAYPDWDQRKIGIASQLMLKAIAQASGSSISKVEESWKKLGDLGLVAEKLIGNKTQHTLGRTDIITSKVLHNIQKLAGIEGEGSVDSKVNYMVELLSSATASEAKYLVRTILEQLRIGSGSGTIRDAISSAFFPHIEGITDERLAKLKKGKTIELESVPELRKIYSYAIIKPSSESIGREVYNSISLLLQQAYDLTNDWGKVALAAAKGVEALEKIELTIGIPIKVMLAVRSESLDDALDISGVPAAAEYKYDGFRLQIHREKEKITLFTRRLENVTAQFPDAVEAVKNHVRGNSFILDAEAVGFDPKTSIYLPFQSISQRIKRKYGIDEMAKKFPIELNVFDIIEYNGKSLLHEPFNKRRKIVESIISPKNRKIVPSKYLETSDKKEIEKFYRESLKAGNEGIMLKKIDAPYKPGARVGYMVKFKPTMETLDLVIVGAEWGEGKRSKWLSSYVIACRDGNEFREVGRVATGFKEKEEEGVSYSQLTELLKPLITEEKGKEVVIRPKIVIEVSYEEIQKSPTYSSGYALRFPRLYRFRDDKGIKDASTIHDVERLYNSQKKSAK